MIETQLQKEIVDVVRARGGFAFKMAHRFTVGVPDLFVKLPDQLPFFVEVKLNRIGLRTTTIRPGLSTLQFRFLSQAADAGMDGYIFSGVIQGDRFGTYMYHVADVDEPPTVDNYQWGPMRARRAVIEKVMK